LQAKTFVAGQANTSGSPSRQRAPAQHRLIDTTALSSSSSSQAHHQSAFTLQCLSPRRSSSLKVTYLPDRV